MLTSFTLTSSSLNNNYLGNIMIGDIKQFYIEYLHTLLNRTVVKRARLTKRANRINLSLFEQFCSGWMVQESNTLHINQYLSVYTQDKLSPPARCKTLLPQLPGCLHYDRFLIPCILQIPAV